MKLNKRSRWIIVATVLALLSVLSQVDSVQATFSDLHVITVLLRVETEIMQKTPAGQYYDSLYWKHGNELIQIITRHPENNKEIWHVIRLYIPGLEALLGGEGNTVRITSEQVDALEAQLDWFYLRGSLALRKDIEKENQRLQLKSFSGMTMQEAWDSINSRWTPDMVVQPTSMPESVVQPPSMPKLVVDQTLVPDSNGKWAYYVHNGVYLEYPASYHIYLGANSILFMSSTNLSDWNDPSSIMVDIWYLPVARKDTLAPDYWYSNFPKSILWQRIIQGGEFEGAEYISSVPKGQREPVLTLGMMLYHQENQLAVHIYVNGIPTVSEDFALVGQRYEYYKHMADNIRMQTP